MISLVYFHSIDQPKSIGCCCCCCCCCCSKENNINGFIYRVNWSNSTFALFGPLLAGHWLNYIIIICLPSNTLGLSCHVIWTAPHCTAPHPMPCHAIHIWVSPHKSRMARSPSTLFSNIIHWYHYLRYITLRACRIIIEIVIVIMTIRRRQRQRQRFGVNIY